MAILRSLLVTVGMKDDDFRKGVKRMKADMADFASGLAGLGLKAAAAGAAITAGIGVGLAALTKSSMESIDQTSKLADRLGVTTELLTGLEYAAGLSGVSLDELKTGMEKFVKQLPVGTDVTMAFQAAVEDIKNISDPVARAHLAMEKFGKSGQSLLPLLTSNLKEAQAEAVSLGLTFSRGQGSLVEAANDALSKVSKMFVGLGNTMAIELSPFIKVAADKLREFLDNGKLMRDLVVPAIQFTGKAVAWLADIISLAQEAWYNLAGSAQKALSMMLKVISQAMQAANDAAAALWSDGPFNQEDVDAIAETAKGFGDSAAASFKKATLAYGEFVNGTKSTIVTREFNAISRAAKEMMDSVNAAAPKFNGPAAPGAEAFGIFGGPNGPAGPDMVDLFSKQIEQMGKALKDSQISKEFAQSFIDQFQTAREKIEDQLDKLEVARPALDPAKYEEIRGKLLDEWDKAGVGAGGHAQAFAQVDLSRTAVGGFDFARKIANDQVKAQQQGNEILKSIDRKLEGKFVPRLV